jgi:small subunit ribosomal protein S9
MEVIHTIGRRKSAVARVYMSQGKGEVTINKKSLDSYFPTPTHQYKINQPFTLTDTLGKIQPQCDGNRWWANRSG